MFGFIEAILSGLLSPITKIFTNAQNVGLAEFQAASVEEQNNYLAFVQALTASNQAKISNTWWGAHIMVYLFGLPAALHWGAVFLVSTFPALYDIEIRALPSVYAGAEQTIALSFFILAPTMLLGSSVSAFFNRK